MATKLQVGKPVAINSIAGATVPDAIAKIGNIKLEDDGTTTYAIHYYLSVEDANNNVEPIAFKTFNMDIPNLENQILAHAKTHASLDAAIDIV